jgi:hypothetical protein
MLDTKDLLSASPDEFFDNPNTKAQPKKVKSSVDTLNVCVIFKIVSKQAFHVVLTLGMLCAPEQQKTTEHTIALLVKAPDSKNAMRLGFCSVLSANSLIFRLCSSAQVDVEIYRDWGLPTERKMDAEGSQERPFRF